MALPVPWLCHSPRVIEQNPSETRSNSSKALHSSWLFRLSIRGMKPAQCYSISLLLCALHPQSLSRACACANYDTLGRNDVMNYSHTPACPRRRSGGWRRTSCRSLPRWPQPAGRNKLGNKTLLKRGYTSSNNQERAHTNSYTHALKFYTTLSIHNFMNAYKLQTFMSSCFALVDTTRRLGQSKLSCSPHTKRVCTW